MRRLRSIARSTLNILLQPLRHQDTKYYYLLIKMNAQKNHYNYEFHTLMILKTNLLYFFVCLCDLVVNYYLLKIVKE
jgi:hypothetical protein